MQLVDTIIRDSRENKKKCTIYPLHYRCDLRFISRCTINDFDYSGYLLLHVDGEPLSIKDKDCPLLLIDASWRWADQIFKNEQIATLPRRSISGFKTAYPRKSNFYQDPANGLASVEALYLSFVMRGKEDISLLDHYHWKEQFFIENEKELQTLKEGLR